MRLSEEISVVRDDLPETFVDSVFSVEARLGHVRVELGVMRGDHRGANPKRSSIPMARLVLTPAAVRMLRDTLSAALDVLPKMQTEDDVAAITPPKEKTN